MTVFSFSEGDPENPLLRISPDEVSRLPFGALELDRDGKVQSYNDTEPDDGEGIRPTPTGRDFFADIGRWAGAPLLADEFKRGVASGDLNAVFDCAVTRLPYKVRIHLKVSPILGTYWVFVKKLKRS